MSPRQAKPDDSAKGKNAHTSAQGGNTGGQRGRAQAPGQLKQSGESAGSQLDNAAGQEGRAQAPGQLKQSGESAGSQLDNAAGQEGRAQAPGILEQLGESTGSVTPPLGNSPAATPAGSGSGSTPTSGCATVLAFLVLAGAVLVFLGIAVLPQLL